MNNIPRDARHISQDDTEVDPPAHKRTCSASFRLVILAAICWIQTLYPVTGETTPTPEEAVPHAALSLEELQHRGLTLALAERYDEAVPLLEQALRRDPTRIPLWEALGWAYWYQDRAERTKRLWDRLVLIAPDEPQAHNLLASYHLRRNELDQSIARYERSLSLDPRQTEIRFTLAQAYRWSGHLQRAVSLLTPLVEEHPERDDMRLELARALTSNWAYADALPHWTILRETDPNALEYLIADAVVHLHTGQVEAALDLARQALDQDPDDLQALQVKADALEYSDTPASALPWLRSMLAAADDTAYQQHIRSRIALLYERLYRRSRNKEYLASAATLHGDRVTADPENMDARLKYAEMTLLTGQYDIAAALLPQNSVGFEVKPLLFGAC